MLQANVGPVIGQSEEEGARALIYAATSPDMEGANLHVWQFWAGGYQQEPWSDVDPDVRARHIELVIC